MTRRLAAILVLAGVVAVLRATPLDDRRSSPLAQQIARLSEPGGYFDTDNLISNESSYLQVVPELRRADITGGAYIGVGPDQNFTYIAAVRPSIAFIVDIRRDNLLLHLLFKALFERSRTRVDYLAMLFGRPVPANTDGWRAATIERIAEYIERSRPAEIERLRAQIDRAIASYGVPLSADDLRTIDRFHRSFIEAGLSLRFQTSGQAPRSYYPSYRDLLLDRDSSGRQTNVFASEDAFQFVRSLESRDLVIPVVGDLGGRSALAAVGRLIAARHEQLTAFYTSNVEFYLFGNGRFDRFVANLGMVPHAGRAVIIRSIFNRFTFGVARRGDDSVSRIDRIDDLLAAATAGKIRGYGDLIGR